MVEVEEVSSFRRLTGRIYSLLVARKRLGGNSRRKQKKKKKKKGCNGVRWSGWHV